MGAGANNRDKVVTIKQIYAKYMTSVSLVFKSSISMCIQIHMYMFSLLSLLCFWLYLCIFVSVLVARSQNYIYFTLFAVETELSVYTICFLHTCSLVCIVIWYTCIYKIGNYISEVQEVHSNYRIPLHTTML